jgi:hypothetical protein
LSPALSVGVVRADDDDDAACGPRP